MPLEKENPDQGPISGSPIKTIPIKKVRISHTQVRKNCAHDYIQKTINKHLRFLCTQNPTLFHLALTLANSNKTQVVGFQVFGPASFTICFFLPHPTDIHLSRAVYKHIVPSKVRLRTQGHTVVNLKGTDTRSHIDQINRALTHISHSAISTNLHKNRAELLFNT